MGITWYESIEGLNWQELEAPYHAAPLGNKDATDLQTVFSNSRFRCLANEDGRLVAMSRVHQKVILYAVPGKKGCYRKLGFLRMLTAMAIFENPATAIERGRLSDDSPPKPVTTPAQLRLSAIGS
jgi:hypothetical protein